MRTSPVPAAVGLLALAFLSGCPGSTGAGVASPPVPSGVSPAPAVPAATDVRPGRSLDLSGPDVKAAVQLRNEDVRIHVLPVVEVGDRDVVRELVGTPKIPREVCFYTVRPGVADDNRFAKDLSKLGYNPKPIDEGRAIVFAELDEADFDGIGICCTPSGFSVCCAVKTQPVFSFWIPSDPNGAPATQIAAVLARVKASCDASKNALTFGKPIDIVLAGSSAKAPGLLEAARAELKKVGLPIAVRELRLPKDPETSVVRGALVAAAADPETPPGDSCHWCGAAFPEGARSCPKCGKPR